MAWMMLSEPLGIAPGGKKKSLFLVSSYQMTRNTENLMIWFSKFTWHMKQLLKNLLLLQLSRLAWFFTVYVFAVFPFSLMLLCAALFFFFLSWVLLILNDITAKNTQITLFSNAAEPGS